MKVLVAYESKHGATGEIATAIGDMLHAQGVEVEVRRMIDVDTVMPYDAFVLGSAVYMGSWMRPARQFLDEHSEILSLRPTWLFSSGPIGSPSHAAADFDACDLVESVQAREHHLFGGKIDKQQLSLAERGIAGVLRVPAGDFREWDAVAAWATAIARVLHSNVPA